MMTLERKQKHKTPSETIRSYCHYCVQSRSDLEVENCTGNIVFATGAPCPFYKYRMGRKRPSVKAMRQFCLECMGNKKEAVKECEIKTCLIYPFRLGKNPTLAGKGKSRDEMFQIRALRRPFSKENLVYFERSAPDETHSKPNFKI